MEELNSRLSKLVLNKSTKVLKIGEVIQLTAKRKELSKGAGIYIPHINHNRLNTMCKGDMYKFTCHPVKIRKLFLVWVNETLIINDSKNPAHPLYPIISLLISVLTIKLISTLKQSRKMVAL